AHAAVEAEAFAARKREVHESQKIFVPTNRDAVLRDAAEAREHAPVEFGFNLSHVAHRARHAQAAVASQLFVQRLYLQPVNPDDAEAFVQKEMRERVTGGA